jgi:F420-0:gamma-glutamyl ligase
LTLKDNLLIPTSGIDESNANGYYILWPDQPFLAAKKLHQFVTKTHGLKKIGIIISDSRSNFLRFGVTGIAIGFYGFQPLKDYRGSKDIFDRTLKLSQNNIADSLAAAAVCQMGEGDEKTPIAIIENIKHINFTDVDFTKHNPLAVDRKNDIYAPLLNSAEWQKGGKHENKM